MGKKESWRHGVPAFYVAIDDWERLPPRMTRNILAMFIGIRMHLPSDVVEPNFRCLGSLEDRIGGLTLQKPHSA